MKIFKYLENGQTNVIEADNISIEELKNSWLDLKSKYMNSSSEHICYDKINDCINKI